MDVYLIVLQGQGDTEISIVDKETYDWVVNPDNGKDPNMSKKDEKRGSWKDLSLPDSVLNKIKEQGLLDKDSVYVSMGSYNNDRAFYAPVIYINNEKGFFSSFKDAINWIKKHDLNIVEEFEGYIY